MAWRVAFVFLLVVFGFGQDSAVGEGTDWAAKLREFAAKIAPKPGGGDESISSPTPAPADESVQARAMAASQLRQLTWRMKASRFEEIAQGLDQTAVYLPPNLQEELHALAREYREEMARRLLEAQTNWRKEIDQLAEETRAACLEAKNASQLEGVLARCASLEARGRTMRDDERSLAKLRSMTQLINRWMDYLELKAGGYQESALRIANEIRENRFGVPIISQQEIGKHFAEVEGILSMEEAMRQIYEPIKDLADLRAAADRAQQLLSRPGLDTLSADERSLRSLSDRWEAWRIGGPDVMRRRTPADIWPPSSAEYLRKWNQALLRTVAAAAVTARVGWAPEASETEVAFLQRAIDELYARGDFTGAADLMRFAGNALDEPGLGVLDRRPLERFLAGQRFEAAGDFVAAVDCYRDVVNVAGKYSPQKEAAAALSQLRTTHQALVDDPESVLVQKVRAVAESLKQ